MKKIRVAINGLGRIGRVFIRIAEGIENIDIVAINELSDNITIAHLLKYDSVHGLFFGNITCNENEILINKKKIPVFKEKDPANLPWKSLNIDVVLESSGMFLTKPTASKHLKAGAKRVVLSAPPKDKEIKVFCMGATPISDVINENIISNASCTTNSLIPMIRVIKEIATIQSAYITTVHSYTNDQKIHDSQHKDLRRARAAANSIIPTSTGAAKAVIRIYPELEGKIGAIGVRVPVIDGSLTDLTLVVNKKFSKNEINNIFKKYAENELKDIMEYTEDPIVSIDIIGNSHSCIFDAGITNTIGNMVKIAGWYDNEYGYSCRLVDLILQL